MHADGKFRECERTTGARLSPEKWNFSANWKGIRFGEKQDATQRQPEVPGSMQLTRSGSALRLVILRGGHNLFAIPSAWAFLKQVRGHF